VPTAGQNFQHSGIKSIVVGDMNYSSGTTRLTRRTVLCGCCAALTGIRIVPAFAALGDDPASAPPSS
jgi:hypothetical protein